MSKQTKHHKQASFLEKVQRLTNTLEEMGNPFQEESGDLLSLHTKDIASPSNAERIATHLSTGNAQGGPKSGPQTRDHNSVKS